MNLKFLATLLVLFPGITCDAFGADNARVGVQRMPAAGARMQSASKTIKSKAAAIAQTNTTEEDAVYEDEVYEESTEEVVEDTEDTSPQDIPAEKPKGSSDCRDAYRACMDEFCMLDESEGYRCACSSNIESSKSLIQEIQKIQEEADKLYTEGVERENLGAKARLVFGESEAAKKSSRISGLSFSDWLKSGSDDEEEEGLGTDYDIGDNLYAMASEYCASELESCGAKAEMEEMLYSRQVVADCKSFNLYLADQKSNAQANKRTAEAAVRQARLAMLDTTNKYNRGECLLAYRACIADKGGCGTNFENCLDPDLLGRRANACEGVLDQCMAVRKDVLKDWEAESEAILVDAVKYADRYRRQTCLAQIQVCLEDGCSTSTNSACLTDVNVAAGICPIIDECNDIIPGLKTVVNDKLGYLRTQFCQNDIDACLRDRCGENFTAPECVGKTPMEIIELCPQDMFPSCKNETQYDVIVSAAVLQMDYQMMQGCVNYFSEQLGRTCGTDMACLASDSTVAALTEIPEKEQDMINLRKTVIANSKAAVNEFFKQFEKDKTVAACQDAEKPAGRSSLGSSVFNTAKLIAEIGAENRAMRELETKIAELSRQQDLEEAEKNCLNTYKVEAPNKSEKNYSYIKSVSFEPSLRNCRVCRVKQVCETGGESKATSALKAASGGLSAGAAAGTMVSPGWGTAIGGVVGAVGMGIMGAASGGEKEFCRSDEVCEDINM
ncbi:MAG: hypothetical protein R8M71_00510 [Alphaproteobacteria bacterium]|nr:hypothetical protein [Alphaproteobacteria bacterium]